MQAGAQNNGRMLLSERPGGLEPARAASAVNEPNKPMRMCRGTTGFWVQGAAVEVLRAVYEWSNRNYHRELLRLALWRIGRSAADERRQRELNCGSVMSVRHGQRLTPG